MKYFNKRHFLYKASKSLIPTLLLTLTIGMCYAFSLFVAPISQHLNVSVNSVQFAFCLNILFLGLGAAFFGTLIENKIKNAAWLSTFLFFIGMCVSGIGMLFNDILFLYLGFGFLCGVAEGIGYVVPVLNNILWFGRNKHKGMVAALSIVCFGLGSSLCSFLFNPYMDYFGIEYIFFGFALTYFIMQCIGSFLINKPKFAILKLKEKNKKFNYNILISDKYAQKSWFYMFLNISAGLVIIGSCAGILKKIGLTQNEIIYIMMLCGIANGAGRLIFPFISDYVKTRLNMLLIISIIEIFALCLAFVFPNSIIIPIVFIIINATYGSFFALLPSILSDHYGNNKLSIRHSAILSAWGIASLYAYLIMTFVINYLTSLSILFITLIFVYGLNCYNIFMLKRLK